MGDMADIFLASGGSAFEEFWFGDDEGPCVREQDLPHEHFVLCPTCKTQMPMLRTDYGLQYVCQTCDCTHGAHQKTGEPLGIPADKVTRSARMAAHAALDSLWKSGRMSRRETYAWLAEQLKMSPDSCHIGRFDLETCNEVSKLCLRKMYGL